MSVYINGYDILESNTIIMDETEKDLFIDIEYREDKLGTLHVVFTKEDGEAGIITCVENDQMIVRMINFYDYSERFSISPILLGTAYENRKIKMHIMSCIRGESKKIRVTTYTLFLEKENGKQD